RPADRSAIQDVVEPKPEHPRPDVVLGQIHQLAASADPGQEHATEVYAAFWYSALLITAAELPDPLLPPIEELARAYFELYAHGRAIAAPRPARPRRLLLAARRRVDLEPVRPALDVVIGEVHQARRRVAPGEDELAAHLEVRGCCHQRSEPGPANS